MRPSDRPLLHHPAVVHLVKSLSVLTEFFRHQRFALLTWGLWLLLVVNPDLLIFSGESVALICLQGALVFGLMLGCVFTVVRHADALAERLGEPYGTLVLTLSATAIEVTLMLNLMLTGDQNPTLLRDTVFATLMVALNGMVGLALTAGGWRHVEQAFNLRGALSFLHIIAPLSLLILVLPNYTTMTEGPTLAPIQEGFLGVLCVLIYAVFLRLQMGRHRTHFDNVGQAMAASVEETASGEAQSKTEPSVLASCLGLLFALLPIVLMSERLALMLDALSEMLNWPEPLAGLIVTSLVLAPEGLGGFRAALANRVQRSINICLGSALSTIALTIPTVLIAAATLGHSLYLGVDHLSWSLLNASLIVSFITFVSGRANLLQGLIHLMIFTAYLFFMFFP